MTNVVKMSIFLIIFIVKVFSVEGNFNNEIQKNIIILKSAAGWKVEAIKNKNDKFDMIFIDPTHKKINVGETSYPEDTVANYYLAIAENKTRNYKFLLFYSCSSIPDWMEVYFLNPDNDIVSSATVDSYHHWTNEISAENLFEEIFIDSDNDGYYELIDNMMGPKYGGKIIYHKFDGIRFVPQWEEIYENVWADDPMLAGDPGGGYYLKRISRKKLMFPKKSSNP